MKQKQRGKPDKGPMKRTPTARVPTDVARRVRDGHPLIFHDALRGRVLPNTPGQARGVAVVGDLAFVADGNSGLRVLDISTPATPSEIGFVDTPGSAYGVAVDGDHAYVADNNEGLRVIDVSVPGSPSEVAFLSIPGNAFAVALAGDHAFVAARNEGVRVIDISVPTAPTEIGFFDPGSIQANDIMVAGDRAYVSTGYYGLLVLDVSNPSTPIEVGSYDTAGHVEEVALDDGIIVAADTEAGLALFDGCSDILFDDGFEALGTSAWSSTQP